MFRRLCFQHGPSTISKLFHRESVFIFGIIGKIGLTFSKSATRYEGVVACPSARPNKRNVFSKGTGRVGRIGNGSVVKKLRQERMVHPPKLDTEALTLRSSRDFEAETLGCSRDFLRYSWKVTFGTSEWAYRFRRRTKLALRQLPNIRIDADRSIGDILLKHAILSRRSRSMRSFA